MSNIGNMIKKKTVLLILIWIAVIILLYCGINADFKFLYQLIFLAYVGSFFIIIISIILIITSIIVRLTTKNIILQNIAKFTSSVIIQINLLLILTFSMTYWINNTKRFNPYTSKINKILLSTKNDISENVKMTLINSKEEKFYSTTTIQYFFINSYNWFKLSVYPNKQIQDSLLFGHLSLDLMRDPSVGFNYKQMGEWHFTSMLWFYYLANKYSKDELIKLVLYYESKIHMQIHDSIEVEKD
jgi:hypothetical protein